MTSAELRQQAERYARTIALIRAFVRDDPEEINALLDGVPADVLITDLVRFCIITLATSDEPPDAILDRLSSQATAILEHA